MRLRTSLRNLVLATLFALSFTALAADYVPAKATFSGLFFETNGVWQQSAGYFTLSTTTRARYSAKLQLGTERFSFSGQLDGSGSAAYRIPRRYEEPLTVQFQVDSQDPTLVFGSVSNVNWTATLVADQAVFDGRRTTSTDAGQYTMVIPGDFTSTNTPGGEGYGIVTVTKAGGVRFAGVLADGTKLTQSAHVSKDGIWPFYGALYAGQGALYSWMQFNTTNGDLNGYVDWIRPEMDSAWYYPAGFAVEADAWGSRYVRPPGMVKVMGISNGHFEFNGGELAQGITNSIMLDSRNRIFNQSSNPLKVSLALSSGLFSGRVADPSSGDWVAFKGVVLQRYNVGAGFFTGWTQTGEVWLQGD